MPRRLANGLTLLSAVVCVGSAMWVGRSVFYVDSIGGISLGQKHVLGAGTIDGQLVLARGPGSGSPYHLTLPAAEVREDLDQDLWKHLHGNRWLGIGWGRLFEWTFLILPLWLLPLLTAIAPVRWWRRRRREAGRGFPVTGTINQKDEPRAKCGWRSERAAVAWRGVSPRRGRVARRRAGGGGGG